jgi:CubicO group peptidase (beta-lactamase class C family)
VKAALALALLAIWAVATIALAPLGWLRPPLTEDQTPEAFATAARAAVPADFAGVLVLLLLEDGIEAATFAIGGEVGPETAFQIASLSKWVTAAGVLTLVRDGSVALDDPVAMHLRRWQLPSKGLDAGAVTIRHLLSHTGGLRDGLGYDGVEDPDAVQDIVASLRAPADEMVGARARIAAEEPPGRFAYSGGGYAVLQLLVEDVTGQTFADAMRARVLDPLGMDASGFDAPRAPLAPFLYEDGSPAPHYRYAVPAAASFYATASDLGRLLAGLSRPAEDGGLLSADTLDAMAAPQAGLYGWPVWGLGTTTYVVRRGTSEVIGHDGHNRPAINTAARLHPASGDGIVVLASGTVDLASQLADEWTYWRTGRVSVTALLGEWRISVLLAFLLAIFGTVVASTARRR